MATTPTLGRRRSFLPAAAAAGWKPGVLLAPGSFSGRHCNHQRHVLSDRLPRAPSPLAVLMCLQAGGGNPMSESQRVSRGFHRLAVLSAAIPLLLGIIYSLWSSYQTANNELDRHDKLECAREHAALWPPVTTSSVSDDEQTSSVGDDEEMGIPLSLKSVGCSDRDDDMVSYAEAANPPEFNWWKSYARHIASILALTAAISLGAYSVIRAIGWVIGRFAAS